MATFYRRLTAQDGAKHIKTLLTAFEVLYGPYDAFLRGGEVYETDYYNRQAHLIRLTEIMSSQARIVSINQRVMHVEIAYIGSDFLYPAKGRITVKILTPNAVRPPYLNIPELFIISKDP